MTDLSDDVHDIERRVVVDTNPAVMRQALSSSIWWPALDVEPCGTGSAVAIRASITPRQLGQRIEQLLLIAVLNPPTQQPSPSDTRTTP